MTEKEYKELEHLRKVLGVGDIATRSYKTVVKILEQQVEYLNTITIKTLITSDDSAKKVEYKNAKELWEGMTNMILKLNKVKNELGIEYVEKEEEEIPVSPQSVGLLKN